MKQASIIVAGSWELIVVVVMDRVDLVTDVIVVRVWSWTSRLDNFHVTIMSTERVLFAGRVPKRSELTHLM